MTTFLYNMMLLTAGADAGTDAAPTEKNVAFTATSIDAANAVDYTIASFTPGTYLFKVTFEKTGSNKKFYWSDVLVVLPGKTINNAVGIPNVIGEKPEAPTAFKAGYVENSEDKFSGWYTTAFEWERGAEPLQYGAHRKTRIQAGYRKSVMHLTRLIQTGMLHLSMVYAQRVMQKLLSQQTLRDQQMSICWQTITSLI